ncbi:hypothetical protein ROA7450_02271 [Roseovarius albus]|uniref:CBU-0592-like domain-containing protein n=1 Tax=Roseovarius albus TaxID=1247867 RepID=A0A1X6ZAN8_9RHOB|nr:hypothetical protein [Roseovarius albus]SLN46307.1 hypothetical protein ROA7450_02271 [Roseovarius albus]
MPSISFETIDTVVLCRAVGLLGFSIYVIGFFSLCSGRLNSSTPAYSMLVFIASSCVMISLLVEFNLSAALIQLFYIVMSLGGIFVRLSGRKKSPKRPENPVIQSRKTEHFDRAA